MRSSFPRLATNHVEVVWNALDAEMKKIMEKSPKVTTQTITHSIEPPVKKFKQSSEDRVGKRDLFSP